MDPSGSFGADQASSQSSQTKDNIGMEPVYYNAAAKGDIGGFENIPKSLNQLLTPNRNTVLHIYLSSLKESESKDSKPKDSESKGLKSNDSKSEDSESKDSNSKDSKLEDSESPTTFVKEILRNCPSLLWLANVKGETPLHVAARYGHAAIVEVLIEHAKSPQQDLESNKTVQEMLETTNNEKDTALHEAVRNYHLEVVKLLIQEGPDFSYSQNKAGETPLYIAVERNFEDVAFHILDKCKSPAHDGPLGRTTLHAAVIASVRRYFFRTPDMIREILEGKTPEEKSALIKQVDKQRWTPLHCAAYFNCVSSVKGLLEVEKSVAYMKDAKGMTALHIAAHRGHLAVMKSILEGCPDCCELVDERGWNALHFVVNSSSSIWANHGAKHILENSSISNLLNEKDARGNTPLHHHSNSLHYIKDIMCHDRADKMAFNKQNLNAYGVALTSEELSDKKFKEITLAISKDISRDAEFRRPLEDDILPERKDYIEIWMPWEAEWKAREAEWKVRKDRFVSIMKETSQYHLVVDTLIATVTFTAGITMPGGFIGGQEGPHSGSPVLMRNTAFKAFIITNTIAMVQSCSAAFIQLFMPLLFLDKDAGDFSFPLASLAFCLSISAMGAMVLAFVMGTYAVLMHSWGLAIANSVLGLFFFIPVFFVSIGCLNYLLEILRVGSSWIVDRLCDFKDFLCDFKDFLCDFKDFLCDFGSRRRPFFYFRRGRRRRLSRTWYNCFSYCIFTL